MRQMYQLLNSSYNKMAEVREEDYQGMKEAKQFLLNAMVELNSQLNGDWE